MSPEYHTGTWQDERGVVFDVTVLDKENAVLSVKFDDSGSSGKPKMRTVKARILVGREWKYASIPAAEAGSDIDGYYFVCIHSVPTRTIIWMPDRMKFQHLVKEGIIAGELVQEGVILSEVTPELIDIVESGRHGILFDWQNPMVFKKRLPIADENKAEQIAPGNDG
jgi:hypothetical protein